MASSYMTMTASFFGGAIAPKPATATATTRRSSQLAVRASMDLEKVVAAAAETTNTRRGLVLAGMAAAAASSVVKVAMADDAKDTILGGWTPISNPSAPEIFQIATFAVSEHNKERNASLVLESVIRGEKAVVSGLKYRLEIVARDTGTGRSNNYLTVIFSQAAPTLLDLLSFEPRVL